MLCKQSLVVLLHWQKKEVLLCGLLGLSQTLFVIAVWLLRNLVHWSSFNFSKFVMLLLEEM